MQFVATWSELEDIMSSKKWVRRKNTSTARYHLSVIRVKENGNFGYYLWIGIAIYPKYKLNNTVFMKSKP